MKKFNAILAAAALALPILTAGCSDNEEKNSENLQISQEISSSSEASSIFSDNSTAASAPPEIPEKIPDGKKTFFVGLDKKNVYTSEVSEFQLSPNWDPKKAKYSELEAAFASGEPVMGGAGAIITDFLYYVEPNGKNFNRFDNPEMFDNIDGIYIYNGDEIINENPFKRLNVGEKYGTLSLKSAKTTLGKFSNDSYFEASGTHFWRSEAEFSGEIELTGRLEITKVDPDKDIYKMNGEIKFYCDSKSDKLPIIYTGNDPLDRGGWVHTNFDSGLGYYSDSVIIYFAKKLQETSIDMAGITYGDSVKVKVTIGNLIMNSTSPTIRAELLSVKRV